MTYPDSVISCSLPEACSQDWTAYIFHSAGRRLPETLAGQIVILGDDIYFIDNCDPGRTIKLANIANRFSSIAVVAWFIRFLAQEDCIYSPFLRAEI